MQERCTEQAEPAINRRNRASYALSSAVLAEQCHLELKASRQGEPYDEAYVLELFRRATVECDQEAWHGCSTASARSCSGDFATIRAERWPLA
jgi:hypothetical protein